MLIKDLHYAIELCYNADLPLMLWGDTGVGKTAMIRNFFSNKGIRVVDLYASQLEGTELRGLPFIDKSTQTVKFASLDELPQDDKFVLFLDECIDGRHYIVTDKGLQTIASIHKQVQQGKIVRVKSWDTSVQKFVFKRVTNSWCRGKKKVIKLKFNNTKTVTCTPNHLFLTTRGYIEARHLKKQDKVISFVESKTRTATPALNDDQLQLIYGSILGAGCLHGNKHGSRLVSYVHGEPQKDYIEYKANVLQCQIKKRQHNGIKQTPAYIFTTRAINEFYGMSKDEIIEYAIRNIDHRGLAIWFCDDGSIGTGAVGGYIHKTLSSKHADLIIQRMKELGYEVTVHTYIRPDTGNKHNVFYISARSFKKFSRDIAPYVPLCMRYKLHPDYRNVKFIPFNNKYKNYGYYIFKEFKQVGELYATVYDIEVEDTHNFIIASERQRNGVVVHNCNRAETQTLQALFQLINERRIGNKQYDCYVIAACNPSQSNFHVTELDEGILRRFVHIGVTNTSEDVSRHLRSIYGSECPYLDFFYSHNIKVCDATENIPFPKIARARSIEWAVKLYIAQQEMQIPHKIYKEVLYGILPGDLVEQMLKFKLPLSIQEIVSGKYAKKVKKLSMEQVKALVYTVCEYATQTNDPQDLSHIADFLILLYKKYTTAKDLIVSNLLKTVRNNSINIAVDPKVLHYYIVNPNSEVKDIFENTLIESFVNKVKNTDVYKDLLTITNVDEVKKKIRTFLKDRKNAY